MNIRGKKCLVLGLAKEGIAAVKVLHQLGAKVLAYDMGAHDEWVKTVSQELPALNKRIFFGPTPPSEILEIQMVILTGGQEIYRDLIETFSSKAIPVLSPLEFTLQCSKLPYIAVTGTNGKSTVAKMTEMMLEESGKKVFLGGGAFDPFLKLLGAKKIFDLAVYEVSSTALENVSSLKPAVAVLTNLAPHHFERYATQTEYFATKGKIFSNQDKNDVLVYNAENAYAVKLAEKAPSRVFPIYLSNPHVYSKEITEYASYENKKMFLCRRGEETETYFSEKMQVKGLHQIANALSALTAARLMGATPAAIQTALQKFTSLPHRLQKCFEKNGLTFFDDTSSWNPAATAWGLASFKKPVILIMGGINRGANYAKLYRYVKKKVKLLILSGEVRRKMYQHLKEATDTYLTGSLEEAVHLAIAKSQPGDTVVFSPAAAPEPHLYAGYDGRGERFLELIKQELTVEFEQKRKSDSVDPYGIKI
jgi:UDP-N-acetylmuramoylalanine--D-glutamate ligase